MADLKELNEKSNDPKHTLLLSARTHTELSGVTEVLSFDEVCVMLSTVCGELAVEGEGLRVGTLDMKCGIVVINGKVNGLYYTDQRDARKKGFFGGRR